MKKFEFLGKLYNSLEEAENKLNEWCELTNTKIESSYVNNGIHSYDYVIKESWGVKCNSILIKEITDMEEYNPEHKIYWKVTFTRNDHPEYGAITTGVVANSKKAARVHVNETYDATIINIE